MVSYLGDTPFELFFKSYSCNSCTGFDYDNYDNSVGDVTRTDLEVAWGGRWGCPDVDNKQCTAFVQGAMCEAEKKEGDDDGKLRRILNDNNNDNGNDNNDGEEEAEEEENEELEEDVEEEEEENEDLEEDIEDEENENEELEEEVEEESEELEEYEEYTEELEEEVIDMEDYTYYYDDDMMYDSYWDEQDWGNVWVSVSDKQLALINVDLSIKSLLCSDTLLYPTTTITGRLCVL